MENPFPRCTLPVEICGKICEFRLRPDLYYTRVPVDIWRLFNTALSPLPQTDMVQDDNLSECIGICTGELTVMNRVLPNHTIIVNRDVVPTIGLSTLKDLRLIYNFCDATFQFSNDSVLENERSRRGPSFEPNDSHLRPSEGQMGRYFDSPQRHFADREHEDLIQRLSEDKNFRERSPFCNDDRPMFRSDDRLPYHDERVQHDMFSNPGPEFHRDQHNAIWNEEVLRRGPPEFLFNTEYSNRLQYDGLPNEIAFHSNNFGDGMNSFRGHRGRAKGFNQGRKKAFTNNTTPKQKGKKQRSKSRCTKCSKFGHIAKDCLTKKA